MACFNSKLVRLEVVILKVLGGFYLEFQFQIGAIRGVADLQAIKDLQSFNSKLVRLEAMSAAKSRQFAARFQFQIGAIRGTPN